MRDVVEVRQDGVRRRVPIDVFAEAELAPGVFDPLRERGGYDGPLAYRQRKPMRPGVALAFDRMERAARADGVTLLISSGYRSDAEQPELFRRHPDPKCVAPPGRSLHRYGTGWTSARRRHMAGWPPMPTAFISFRGTNGRLGTRGYR
jgi:D-alanyl-D-alanine carboxypeptidase